MSTLRKRLDQISEAQKLLALATPATDYLPERIEACEVMAFDVQEHINSLKTEPDALKKKRPRAPTANQTRISGKRLDWNTCARTLTIRNRRRPSMKQSASN